MKKFYKYLLLIFSLLLSSCKDRSVYFNYDEMIARVVKIDIIDVPVKTYRTNGIDETVVGTIDEDLIDDFLLDLSKIKFVKPWGISNPNFPEGISFLIYYSNNEYDIVHQFSTYGDIKEVNCTKDEYVFLVDKYYYQII